MFFSTHIQGCEQLVCGNPNNRIGNSVLHPEGESPLGIMVYPNPNNGNFTIASLSAISNALVEINDVIGNTVFKKQFSQLQNEQINISGFDSGIYYVRIMNDNGINETHKIIKE